MIDDAQIREDIRLLNAALEALNRHNGPKAEAAGDAIVEAVGEITLELVNLDKPAPGRRLVELTNDGPT